MIARTFDRVCARAGAPSYLDGDKVTADGRRLGGLYTELDLLAAECLRRGIWDGLSRPSSPPACRPSPSSPGSPTTPTRPACRSGRSAACWPP